MYCCTQCGDGVQVVSGELEIVLTAVAFVVSAGCHVGERHLLLDLCCGVAVLLDVSYGSIREQNQRTGSDFHKCMLAKVTSTHR